MSSVNILVRAERLAQFVGQRQDLFLTMDNQFRLQRSTGLSLQLLLLIRDIALFVSFVINIYLFFMLDKGVKDNQSFDNITETEKRIL